MSPKMPPVQKNRSIIPSLVPQQAFSLDEDAVFEEMADDEEIDHLIEALFPDSIVPR